MLQGKKVLLRPIKRSDIPNFVQWMNDQEVNQFTNRDMPLTEMAEEKWFEKVATQTEMGGDEEKVRLL